MENSLPGLLKAEGTNFVLVGNGGAVPTGYVPARNSDGSCSWAAPGGEGGGGIANPLTADLLAAGFNIDMNDGSGTGGGNINMDGGNINAIGSAYLASGGGYNTDGDSYLTADGSGNMNAVCTSFNINGSPVGGSQTLDQVLTDGNQTDQLILSASYPNTGLMTQDPNDGASAPGLRSGNVDIRWLRADVYGTGDCWWQGNMGAGAWMMVENNGGAGLQLSTSAASPIVIAPGRTIQFAVNSDGTCVAQSSLTAASLHANNGVTASGVLTTFTIVDGTVLAAT